MKKNKIQIMKLVILIKMLKCKMNQKKINKSIQNLMKLKGIFKLKEEKYKCSNFGQNKFLDLLG